MTSDRVWGLLFILLGIAIGLGSQTISVNFPGTGDPGPRLVPLALGVAMTVLGAVLGFRRAVAVSSGLAAKLQGTKIEGDPDGPSERVEPPAVWRRLALGALLIAYVASFNLLGFSAASILFLSGAMILLGDLTATDIAKKALIALFVVLLLGWAMNALLGLSVQGVWLS